MSYTTRNVYATDGSLLAVEYRPAINLEGDTWTAKQLATALRVAKFNATILAQHYGSCAAVTGYGYCVSTSPLPECTC
jgi:hypothetical protein